LQLGEQVFNVCALPNFDRVRQRIAGTSATDCELAPTMIILLWPS
jgi:hypothetical protein